MVIITQKLSKISVSIKVVLSTEECLNVQNYLICEVIQFSKSTSLWILAQNTDWHFFFFFSKHSIATIAVKCEKIQHYKNINWHANSQTIKSHSHTVLHRTQSFIMSLFKYHFKFFHQKVARKKTHHCTSFALHLDVSPCRVVSVVHFCSRLLPSCQVQKIEIPVVLFDTQNKILKYHPVDQDFKLASAAINSW